MKIDLTKPVTSWDIPTVECVNSDIPIEARLWDSFPQEVFDVVKRNGIEISEINEPVFAKGYTSYNDLRYCNGLFYSPKGVVNIETLNTEIYESISEYCHKDTARKAKSLLESVKCVAYKGEFEEDMYRIPFKNGDLRVNKNGEWTFYNGQCTSTAYRLPVSFCDFENEIPTPYFDKWLSDLLEPDDIITLQDYLGYCLLPTNISQEALFLIGDAGTGKSVIKNILGNILGDTLIDAQQGIQEFLSGRFHLPELEYKLVLYDDDLQESALTDSSQFKKFITSTGYVTADRKFGQPFKFKPYARFIACGNFMLSSLYDSTDGFFRRLHPIIVKPTDRKREIIKGFGAKVATEADGIVQWMLVGLYRVLKNNFEIHTSERTREYLSRSKNTSNHFPEFFDTVFTLGSENENVSIAEITSVYKDWCRANSIDERKTRPLQKWIADNCEKYGYDVENNLYRNQKHVRGYNRLSIRPEWQNTPFKIL